MKTQQNFLGSDFQRNFSKVALKLKEFFQREDFSTIFFRTKIIFPKFGNKSVTKRVAKDIDPTRVKRIELTNKDKIRNRLETQAYFPQQSTGFFSILRRTILDYFLPYPPAPPLKDERNCFWLPPEK